MRTAALSHELMLKISEMVMTTSLTLQCSLRSVIPETAHQVCKCVTVASGHACKGFSAAKGAWAENLY